MDKAAVKHVVIVHGVNTPDEEQWEKDFSWMYGLKGIKVHAVDWPSKSFLGDAVRWRLSKSFRRRCIKEMLKHQAFANKISLIVTHSFGQVVVNELIKQVPYIAQQNPHVLNLGGPLTNPVLGYLYKRWRPDPSTMTYVVINRDDPICATYGVWFRLDGVRAHVLINVDTSTNEHPAHYYINHKKVRNRILSLLGLY